MPSTDYSTKRKRSRIRLQLVLREDWLEDPLLCCGGLAFLMTCPGTAAHEETELLTVLKIPFRVRTPIKIIRMFSQGYFLTPRIALFYSGEIL
jgi:hypothetical protein